MTDIFYFKKAKKVHDKHRNVGTVVELAIDKDGIPIGEDWKNLYQSGVIAPVKQRSKVSEMRTKNDNRTGRKKCQNRM